MFFIFGFSLGIACGHSLYNGWWFSAAMLGIGSFACYYINEVLKEML